MEKKLGVIGGSGLYEMEGLENLQTHSVTTPFGAPSDEIVSGRLNNGTTLYFLPRHGKGHRILPSEINYRANIYAMKKLGVEWILSASAVGSMKEEIHPGDMVVPDQFIDRTFRRESTFFGEGIVAHVPFAHPVCEKLRTVVVQAAKTCEARVHDKGTYLCMEGPQFSTRAESLSYRALGVSVIGMTNMPEAKLAREAEMSYATLALATDYDCWHDGHDAVTLEAVMEVMRKNVAMAKKIVREVAHHLPEGKSPYQGLLKTSVVTDPSKITNEVRQRLELLLN